LEFKKVHQLIKYNKMLGHLCIVKTCPYANTAV